jgi:hypothetical protein
VEHHAQRIRSGFQERFRRHSPTPERVVAVKDRLAVQIDVGEGVQPLENQIDVLVRNRRPVGIKSHLIFPVRETDPLKARVVVPRRTDRESNRRAADRFGPHLELERGAML